jgi:hypothetical protein
MSYNSIPFDIDKAKLNALLEKLENNILRKDEAKELIPLLEKEWRTAISRNNAELVMEISSLLIALNAYISEKNDSFSKAFDRISNI